MLVSSPYVLITPEGHPLASLERAGPRDVGEHPQIAHTRQSYIRTFGEMYMRQHGVSPNIVVDHRRMGDDQELRRGRTWNRDRPRSLRERARSRVPGAL